MAMIIASLLLKALAAMAKPIKVFLVAAVIITASVVARGSPHSLLSNRPRNQAGKQKQGSGGQYFKHQCRMGQQQLPAFGEDAEEYERQAPWSNFLQVTLEKFFLFLRGLAKNGKPQNAGNQ